jgi:hypothetical protein
LYDDFAVIKKIFNFFFQIFYFFFFKISDYIADTFYVIHFRSSVAKGDYFFPLLDYFDALFFRMYALLNSIYYFFLILRKNFKSHVIVLNKLLNLHLRHEFNFTPEGRSHWQSFS